MRLYVWIVLNEPVKSFDKSSPGGECTPCASWSLTFFARHRRPRDAPVSWGPRYRQRFPPLHARSNFNLHQGRNRVCRRKELSTLCNRKHFYWKIYIDIFFIISFININYVNLCFKKFIEISFH